MDPRVAGAGIAMAIGMMALLPTFNALNNSYVENVQPPPWIPTPDEIPENFQPPEDMEPPEGWEPPPDAELPPGWEPPPGYDGPIPPGGCPPPVIRYLDEMNQTGSFDAQFENRNWQFSIPKYTVAVAANVTFLDWRAQEVSAMLDPPRGETLEDSEEGAPAGILLSPTPTDETSFTFQITAEDEDSMPPQGTYTLGIFAQLPIDGSYRTSVVVALPCGGMLE